MQHILTFLIVFGLGLPALDLWHTLGLAVLGPLVDREMGAFYLLGGFTAGVMTCLWIRRSSRLRFLATLQHELSHLAMALALGTSPQTISAGERDGLFRYQLSGPVPRVRAFFITIAPYWFSPLLVAPIVLALVVPAPRGWGLFALAWLVAVCLTLPLMEIRTHQPDLQHYYLVPPIAAALWLWAGVATLMLTLLVTSSATALGGPYVRGWHLLAGLFELASDLLH